MHKFRLWWIQWRFMFAPLRFLGYVTLGVTPIAFVGAVGYGVVMGAGIIAKDIEQSAAERLENTTIGTADAAGEFSVAIGSREVVADELAHIFDSMPNTSAFATGDTVYVASDVPNEVRLAFRPNCQNALRAHVERGSDGSYTMSCDGVSYFLPADTRKDDDTDDFVLGANDLALSGHDLKPAAAFDESTVNKTGADLQMTGGIGSRILHAGMNSEMKFSNAAGTRDYYVTWENKDGCWIQYMMIDGEALELSRACNQ